MPSIRTRAGETGATEPAEPGSSASRTATRQDTPYRRAKRDRGKKTRALLISAALEVFGRLGFEGASTRQIAQSAGVNLAAIVYHFGSKQALHVAVAEHVANNINSRIGPVMASRVAPATPGEARAMFADVVDTMTEVILGSAEAELWARFIIREQMQPTEAFDTIYLIMGPMITTISNLVAVILGRPADEETQIRAFTLLGQILVFRFAHALVTRRLNWSEISATEREKIKRIVISQANDIFAAEASR
jgi:AcrR family transcriptional regulator